MGFKQGDLISLTSFNLFLNEIIQSISNSKGIGGNIAEGVEVVLHAFVDNIIFDEDNENNIPFTLVKLEAFL